MRNAARPELLAPALAALFALSTGGAPAQTQPSSTLVGTVLDERMNQPLEGVLIRLDTGPETLTDAEGRFRLIGLEPGTHMLVLLTSDCRVTWAEVDLPQAGAREASFHLPAPEGAAAAEREREDRRRRSQGKILDAADIAEMNAHSMIDVIRRVAPNMVGGTTSQAGQVQSVRGRATNSFEGTPEPVVLVDGVRAPDGSRALDMIDPEDVETLEVLPGAAAGWEFGSMGAGGIIKVTTQKGGRSASPEEAERCVVPGFPGR